MLRGGFGVAYNRIPEVVFSNTRGNPPFFARFQICCGTAATDFGSPFAGGQILYTLGTSSSPFSYPANPALAVGIDPATGTPPNRTVEVYGALADTPTAYVYYLFIRGAVCIAVQSHCDTRIPGQFESQVDSSRESTIRSTRDSGRTTLPLQCSFPLLT